MAMSSNMAFRRSPKPGALIAAHCRVPRSLFTTNVASASPSTSSATAWSHWYGRDSEWASGTARAADYLVHPDGTGDFPTIQAALDAAGQGDVIELADGTFTGDGNRDIDYLGKAITVRSENGPENCIIDLGGSPAEPHWGFVFAEDG